MTRETLEAHIEKMMTKINSLPKDRRESLLKVVEETRVRHAHIQESVTGALNALDDWRLLQKYHIFDLEAKAREDAQRRNEGN